MFEPDHDRKLTRKERLAVILALAASLAVHLAAARRRRRHRGLVDEGEEARAAHGHPAGARGRPAPGATPGPPARPARCRRASSRSRPPRRRRGAGDPPPPQAPRKDRSRAVPSDAAEPELSEKMDEEAREAEAQPEPEQAKPPGAEHGDNSVSVVTDLAAGLLHGRRGRSEYQGAGTFWLRKGAPAGDLHRHLQRRWRASSPPPPQSKEPRREGADRLRRQVQAAAPRSSSTRDPEAQFTVFRPDGRPLDMRTPGRALFDDLPPGNYTVVFKAIPGHVTPGPVTSTLVAGGRLVFCGEYQHTAGVRRLRRPRGRRPPGTGPGPTAAAPRARPGPARPEASPPGADAPRRGRPGEPARPPRADGRQELPADRHRGLPRPDPLPGADHPAEQFPGGVVPGLPRGERRRARGGRSASTWNGRGPTTGRSSRSSSPRSRPRSAAGTMIR